MCRSTLVRGGGVGEGCKSKRGVFQEDNGARYRKSSCIGLTVAEIQSEYCKDEIFWIG